MEAKFIGKYSSELLIGKGELTEDKNTEDKNEKIKNNESEKVVNTISSANKLRKGKKLK